MSKKEQDIIDEAKQRYEEGVRAWAAFNTEAEDVLKFIDGDQWDNQLRQARQNAGLPCLTANSIPTFLRQITNESRQNTPAIQIDPKDDEASVENAEILSDLIRGIEHESNADTAYDTASWFAAATGLGFIRVKSDYVDTETFNQKLVIEAIEDPKTVIIDPNHKCINGSDAEWCFITSLLTKDEYERAYGESKKGKDAKMSGWALNTSSWVYDDRIVIAEYYWKDYEDVTLYQVFNSTTNQTIIAEEKPSKELIDLGILTIVQKRILQRPIIRWAKINDEEILEETSWPGTCIPVITVKGDETWVNGKRHLKGAVKDAMDSQRVLNYYFSMQAEIVSMAPKSPFIAEIRQIEDFESIWRDANISATAYLPYNAVVVNGQLLPPPSRLSNNTDVSAAMGLCAQARDNIKAIFGIYDASLGAQGNETSGKAILARTKQSNTSTYHFYDNLTKGIQQVGQVIIDAIPTFYSDERSVQVIKRNGEASTQTINGEDSQYDVNKGKYGVVVETGPSYATRRQDSVDHMISMGSTYPQAMPLIADIIATESDWPGSKQIAARLRLALPPEIQQAEAAEGKLPPEQMISSLQNQLKQVTEKLKQTDQIAQQLGVEHKNATEENKLLKMKSSVDLEKARMDSELKTQQMQLDELKIELENNIKAKEMELKELTTEMEYTVKNRELALQERQIKVQELSAGIKTVQAMHELDEDMHDRDNEHIDRKVTAISINAGEPRDELEPVKVGNTGELSDELSAKDFE